MKPEQKFILSCRQTGKAAGRLADWLEHNPMLLGAAHSAVCEDIASMAAELTPLAAAAETQPGIALVSTSGKAKSELLFSLLAIRSQTVIGELGQRPMDAATVRSLLPSGGQASSCAVMRFSSDELPPAPRGFPIRVGLLSIVDLAAIITGASLASGGPLARLPDLDDISGLFPDLATRLSPQALPGLSERDVLDLRDLLNSRWPGDPMLAALASTRYWDQFREIAAHLADRDRRRVLSLLWRNDPSYTTLFERLCDGLDKLGQGADGYCPTEALLGKDKASGWLTRHPRSVVDDSTLRTLDQVPGPMIAMMNRYGQTVDIERSVAAGLICEMTLHLATSRLAEFAPADLLDFPVPPPIASTAPKTAHAGTAGEDLDTAIAHFARTKAIYLFERGCHRRDLTSLIIVADPDHDDDSYAQAIGDWVETMQGPTAHARERVRRGLFVAALAGPQTETPDTAQVHTIIREVIGHKQEWPVAWTPNRPMTEVFWFSADETLSPQHNLNVSATPAVLATITPAAGTVAHRSQANIAQLVSALALASNPRAKQLQLHQALQEKRRHIRQTVLRHHTSNDPSALSHWRRSTAVVVQDRLQYLIDQGRLGLLHRALIPSEDDLILPIRAAELAASAKTAASVRAAPWLEPNAGPSGSAAAADSQTVTLHAGRMATIAVAHWFGSMRRAARSLRLCRDLRIEMGVLHNLIDELQIGALRCGLANEIANAYLQSSPYRAETAGPATGRARLAPAGGDLIRLAAYACRIISAYLEVLGTVHGRGHTAQARGVRSSPYDLEVADGSASSYATSVARPLSTGRRTARAALDQWEVSFVSLVEDNIASAHVMAGRGDKDRELGELLQLFASGPFEVEP